VYEITTKGIEERYNNQIPVIDWGAYGKLWSIW
jgi:hypothetical protein